MGGFISSHVDDGIPPLPQHVLEEYRILTGLRLETIAAEHKRFVGLAQDQNGLLLYRKGFLMHPCLVHHPLKERIATVFFHSQDDEAVMTLRQYLLNMADFSNAPSGAQHRQERLKRAFDIWDVDGDGRIGMGDILWILSRTVAFDGNTPAHAGPEADPVLLSGGRIGEQTSAAPKSLKLRAIAERVLAESSSRPDKSYLTKEDFIRGASGVEAMDIKTCLLLDER